MQALKHRSTGFRLAYGGARAYFGVEGDLAVYGKIIGGGLPVAAYGGKARYMRRVAPEGDVYQAGTLSGNPLAVAAGLATLRLLQTCDYAALETRTVRCPCCRSAEADTGIPLRFSTGMLSPVMAD